MILKISNFDQKLLFVIQHFLGKMCVCSGTLILNLLSQSMCYLQEVLHIIILAEKSRRCTQQICKPRRSSQPHQVYKVYLSYMHDIYEILGAMDTEASRTPLQLIRRVRIGSHSTKMWQSLYMYASLLNLGHS